VHRRSKNPNGRRLQYLLMILANHPMLHGNWRNMAIHSELQVLNLHNGHVYVVECRLRA
jgi:hypothetical protein